MTHHLPLTGLRVLDLSTVVAGPFGSEIFASLGAEVIRVEPPSAGKEPRNRSGASTVSDDDGFLFALQRNKSLVRFDLKSETGRSEFLEMVRHSDVVYDNFRPGVLARLGIDHASLTEVNPRIVSCSISGFGSTGPWAEVGAYDVTVQALGGSMSITGTGEPESLPCRWGVPIGDLTGSLYAVIGTLAALRERLLTGRGQAVEVSLLDGQLALNTYRVPQAFGSGMTFETSSPRQGGAGTVPYGPFLCGDGAWLVIGVASNFWKAFCTTVGRSNLIDDPRFATLADRQKNQTLLDAEIERMMLQDSASNWQRKLLAAGVPVGKVNTVAEAFTQPQAVAREMRATLADDAGREISVAASPLRFVGEPKIEQRAPIESESAVGSIASDSLCAATALTQVDETIAALSPVDGPLSGTLVLELCGDEPSGTFGTQMLADLGATVVKVERLPVQNGTPRAAVIDGKVRPDIAYFFGLNRNKKSVCLDLKSAEGREAFLRLAAKADVIYDNYKPGTLAKLGLGAGVVRACAPQAVLCSVSGFGKTGPWSHLPSYDATVQALGGGMSLTGTAEEGTPPVRWGNPVGGIGGAFYAVVGILASLLRRDVTGRTAELDIALLDVQLALHSYRVPPAMSGRRYFAEPRRGGSGAVPYGPFKAGDGRWFVLGITNQFWAAATTLLGHPEWIEDQRFATEQDRQRNEAELNRLVTEAMQAADADAWQERFVAAGIPGAKVQSIPEAFKHPHVALRDMLVTFDHPVGGKLRVAGNPIKLSSHPHRGFAAAPALGADSRDVLEKIGGFGAAELERLHDQRVTWSPEADNYYDRPSVV